MYYLPVLLCQYIYHTWLEHGCGTWFNRQAYTKPSGMNEHAAGTPVELQKLDGNAAPLRLSRCWSGRILPAR